MYKMIKHFKRYLIYETSQLSIQNLKNLLIKKVKKLPNIKISLIFLENKICKVEMIRCFQFL